MVWCPAANLTQTPLPDNLPGDGGGGAEVEDERSLIDDVVEAPRLPVVPPIADLKVRLVIKVVPL